MLRRAGINPLVTNELAPRPTDDPDRAESMMLEHGLDELVPARKDVRCEVINPLTLRKEFRKQRIDNERILFGSIGWRQFQSINAVEFQLESVRVDSALACDKRPIRVVANCKFGVWIDDN